MTPSRRKWKWVSLSTVLAAHDRLIAAHGGLSGIRDKGVIESALARPQNLASYGKPDAAELAAAYVFSLVHNHGFADGNKRTGWLVAEVFLVRNGYLFVCEDAVLVLQVERLAAGLVDQERMAEWIRARLQEG